MSEEYDISANYGEMNKMPSMIMPHQDDEPRENDEGEKPPAVCDDPPNPVPVPNAIETPVKERVNRKKVRSEKQKAVFEKARKKRLENIAKKKKMRKEEEERVLKEMENVSVDDEPIVKPISSPPPRKKREKKETDKSVSDTRGVMPDEVGTIRRSRQKKPKVVFVESSSSESEWSEEEMSESSEEEIIYMKRSKPAPPPRAKAKKSKVKKHNKQKISRSPKVVYYEDEEDHLGQYQNQKPIRFSDVFKYA